MIKKRGGRGERKGRRKVLKGREEEGVRGKGRGRGEKEGRREG